MLLAVVLALLALLVAGLLRSHAEILRALHSLGVTWIPRAPTTVPARHRRSARRSSGRRRCRSGLHARRSTSSAPRPSTTRSASRSSAPSTSRCSRSSRVGAARAWRSGTCSATADPSRCPVTRGSCASARTRARRASRASAASRRPTIPTVMSSKAWADYDVPVAPFFVLVDGDSGEVIGEGAANEWDQVQSLLHTALDDAGMLDRKGTTSKAGAGGKPERRRRARGARRPRPARRGHPARRPEPLHAPEHVEPGRAG